jgi:hypothetical protein
VTGFFAIHEFDAVVMVIFAYVSFRKGAKQQWRHGRKTIHQTLPIAGRIMAWRKYSWDVDERSLRSGVSTERRRLQGEWRRSAEAPLRAFL